MKIVIKAILRVYQRAISPMLKWITTGDPQGALCRYEPTCSHYCEEAVCRYGTMKGLWLTLRRLLRCHPWGGHGYDPVPPVSSSSTPPRQPLSH
ncbi:MAG: putative membrane protein insertion efficiency factor [Verrucomicrobiales bacterium]|jgi:putative membrane protein insertion efficiency factor